MNHWKFGITAFLSFLCGALFSTWGDKPAIQPSVDIKLPQEQQTTEWKTHTPKDWIFKTRDDSEVSEPMFSLGNANDELTVALGNGNPPLAIIHQDGTVILGGNPNRAARLFWDTVGRMMPCKERPDAK